MQTIEYFQGPIIYLDLSDLEIDNGTVIDAQTMINDIRKDLTELQNQCLDKFMSINNDRVNETLRIFFIENDLYDKSNFFETGVVYRHSANTYREILDYQQKNEYLIDALKNAKFIRDNYIKVKIEYAMFLKKINLTLKQNEFKRTNQK